MSIFDEIIDRRGTYCTQWDFVKDRFGVDDLLPFTISDSDFKAPEGTIKLLEEAVRRGLFGYTRWNHPDFKNSKIHWYNSRLSTSIESDWIVFSPSVMFSVAKCLDLLTNPDDGVLILTPAYDAFYHTIRSNQRRVVSSALVRDEKGHYHIDFDDFEQKLADKSTKLFLLCSPHNPTGRVWTHAELSQMVQLCKKYDKYIVSDEIHMDIIRNGLNHIPITNFVNSDWNKIILFTSASKTFNIPALVFSYGLIIDREIREQFLSVLKEKNGLSSCSYLGMLATMECYNHEDEWCNQLCAYIDNQMHFLSHELKTIEGIEFSIQESTYLAWIDVKALNLSMDTLQDLLVKKGKVAIMRGDTYGEEGSHFLRMNIGAPHKKVAEGIRRIKKALEFIV